MRKVQFFKILTFLSFILFCKDIHETITMVRGEKEKMTSSTDDSSTTTSNRKSKIGHRESTSWVDAPPKMSPNSSSLGTSLISISETPERSPHAHEGGIDTRKDDIESSSYTKEITAVVEDLELAPKRRSLFSLYL